MDDSNLEQLMAALKLAPDNGALLMVIIGELRERQDYAQVADLLAGFDSLSSLNEEQKTLIGQTCLDAGKSEAALQYLDDDAPVLLLMRAKALLNLERRSEGLAAYEAAIAKNPALEDQELKRALRTTVTEFQRGKDRPRLTVLSNDDTTVTELSRVLEPEIESVDFAAVGGLDAVKKSIHRKIVLPFQKPGLFSRFRKRIGGGILLYGPPGCGKTLLARATAGECNAHFFNVAISDILDMYIGESERKLNAVFEVARTNTPAVIFFDEVEAIGGKRQNSRDGTSSKLVSQLLAEMDGFAQNNQGVLVLAATNVPWSVDPAFRRPGRFDRVVFVPPPDLPAREIILRLLLDGRPLADDVDPAFIAKRTGGYSGADLREVVETAVDVAIEQSIASGEEVPVGQAHLLEALQQTHRTTTEWLTTAKNYARYSNESGQYDEVLEFLRKYEK